MIDAGGCWNAHLLLHWDERRGRGPLCNTLISSKCHLNGLLREETQESTLGWHTYPGLRLGHVMSPKAKRQGLILGILGLYYVYIIKIYYI